MSESTSAAAVSELTQVENLKPKLERPNNTTKVKDGSCQSLQLGEGIAGKTTSKSSKPAPNRRSCGLKVPRLTIDDQIALLGKRREPVSADGHCLIHSWLRALQAEGERLTQTSQKFLEEVGREIFSSDSFYMPYLIGDWTLQLHAYQSDKVFNSDVVDVVIYALSNLTQRICEVYTVVSGKLRKAYVIRPGRGDDAVASERKPPICLLFRGKHYDPLLPINAAREGDTAVQPSAQSVDTDAKKDCSDEPAGEPQKVPSNTSAQGEIATEDQRPEPVIPEIAEPVIKATQETITVSNVELELKQGTVQESGEHLETTPSAATKSSDDNKSECNVIEECDKTDVTLKKSEQSPVIQNADQEILEDPNKEISEIVNQDDSPQNQEVEENVTLENVDMQKKKKKGFLKRVKASLKRAAKCCFPCVFKKTSTQ